MLHLLKSLLTNYVFFFQKPRFCFKIGEASAQRYCKLTLGRKWVAHRQNLCNEFYDPTKSKKEIISNVPNGIDRTQWAHFVTYRLKPETLVQVTLF